MSADELKAMAEDGLSYSEISREFAISYDAARIRARRAGARVKLLSERELTDHVDAMKPLEAVDYLLGVVQELRLAVSEPDQTPEDMFGVHLSPDLFRTAKYLHGSMGQFRSKEQIYAAVYHDRPDLNDLPQIKIVSVSICKLRKLLDRHKVETSHGFGYRMVEA